MLETTVEEYLRSKGHDVWRAGSGQLTLQCLWHDDASHRKGKLYVSAETGAFDCKVCGTQGGLRMLMEHFGDEPDENQKAFRASRKLAINSEYAGVAHGFLMDVKGNAEILEYLRERGLSDDVITAAKIGYHGKGVSVVASMPNAGVKGGYTRDEVRETGLVSESGREFLTGRITIPYLSYGQVLQVRGKDPKGKYVTPPGEPVRLYNEDALRGAESVILVEGEFDCLILQETLRLSPDAKARNLAVVAIPGTQALPGGKEEFAKHFESARRVYIAFDADDAGRRGAMNVRELIGKAARIVELPDEGCDWTDWLAPKAPHRPNGGHTWHDVMRLVTEADMREKRVFTVQDAAAQLYELEHSAPGIQLGFPTLDAYIKPGLRPGALVIPLARTGVGKSILLANIAYNTRDIPSLFLTLELTNMETWTRLRRIARFHHPAMEEHELQGLFPNLRLVDENAVSSADIDRIIEDFIEDHGQSPQIIYVDYLGYFARGQRGNSQYEKMSNAVMTLKAKAKEHRAVVISPGQVNRGAAPGAPISETDARDAGAIEETADFLFGVWRPWESATVDGAIPAMQSELKLNILKSRHGNKGRVVPLAMSHHSLVMVDAVRTKLSNKVDIENGAYNRGEAYEDVYQRARTAALAKLQPTLPLENQEIPPWEQ